MGSPHMDAVDRVRQLIQIMEENDLAELELEQADLRIKIRKREPAPQYVATPMPFTTVQQPPEHHPALRAAAEEAAPEDEDLIEITSPMVGTFYRGPSAGADPYVSVGAEVDAETPVCIIEAMKVMNEIKAEVEGTVVEILVQDAEPVEFGQALFLVEPSEA